MDRSALPPPASGLSAQRLRRGQLSLEQFQVASEVPVALVLDDVSYAVMMASPVDLEDFAHGFLMTEGLISSADEIAAIAPEASDAGIELHITLADHWPRQPERLPKGGRGPKTKARTLPGRSGCGVCGIEALSQLSQECATLPRRLSLSHKALHDALVALPALQPLNRDTRAMHAAAWASAEGSIELVREDVGRHNALDKLIGAMMRQDRLGENGFCLITSRCSYEIAQKSIAAGFEVLVAVSAPTDFALRLAHESGMTLIGIAREDAQVVYCGAERLHLDGAMAP